jgi:hypothetical protein
LLVAFRWLGGGGSDGRPVVERSEGIGEVTFRRSASVIARIKRSSSGDCRRFPSLRCANQQRRLDGHHHGSTVSRLDPREVETFLSVIGGSRKRRVREHWYRTRQLRIISSRRDNSRRGNLDFIWSDLYRGIDEARQAQTARRRNCFNKLRIWKQRPGMRLPFGLSLRER